MPKSVRTSYMTTYLGPGLPQVAAHGVALSAAPCPLDSQRELLPRPAHSLQLASCQAARRAAGLHILTRTPQLACTCNSIS